MRLVACPACSLHVRNDDPRCPHCDAPMRTTTAAAPSVVLLGLALAGCPADDYRDDLPADTSETSATATTTVGTSGESTGSSDSGTTTMDVTSIGSEAAYGVPETESDSITDTTTGTTGTGSESDSTGTTDGSSSGGSDSTGGDQPLYGAMDTA